MSTTAALPGRPGPRRRRAGHRHRRRHHHRGAAPRLTCGGGEIGYMLLERSSLARFFPGFGDLESRVGSAGLTRQARERGIAAPADRPLTAADVFNLVRGGSVEAGALLEETLDYVALAVANLCTVLDPELVIVGGEMGGAADLITPGLRDRLVGRIPHVPRLAASALGDDAVIVGAAELAARLVSDSAYVQATR
ncbi:ROK family protein [Streptosporangium lutulentum]